MATNTEKSTTEKPAVASDTQIKNLYADGDERKLFRDDLTSAVKAAFTKQEPDPRTRFHEQFRKEADEYDQDFHRKYHDDFNSTLIFAGLFSAVASAFIVDVQSQIRPDYEQMSFTVLTMLLNTTSGKQTQLPLPTFSGPSPSIVQVQSILFASLLSALLAAFLAMLGKQWLNFHVEGSFIDRNRHREQKMRGMITWHFKLVVEFLPLSLQAALLLLGYALARYLWDVSHTVSSVITGFTIVGVVIYLFIIAAGTLSGSCPFQTPISIAIRAILQYYRKDIKAAFQSVKTLFRFARSQTGLVVYRQQLPTPPIASDIDDQDNEVRAELSCILTMFKMTKAPDSVKAIMSYITEIVWDSRLKSVPLPQVYQTLHESLFRSADGKVYPRPGARDKALWSAKALLHLYNQRRCIHRLDPILPNQVKFTNQLLGNHGFDHDPDLQSTFYIVDWTFGGQPEIRWSELELSASHRGWLAHILQYRAWDTLYTQNKLTEDVRGFVAASLSSSNTVTRVVADCLFIVHMAAGRRPEPRDLLIKDRSHLITKLIDDIFDQLENVFGQSTPGDISSSTEALGLLINLRDSRVCARSYSLFRTIMDKANKGNELWSTARLCLQGAYSAGTVPQVGDLERLVDLGVPRVEDPKHILEFLHYHMQERASVGSLPIHHVFSALVVAANKESKCGLDAHNFSGSPLLDTIIEALENKAFAPLQRSTIFMLAQLDRHLFITEEAFQDPGKASRFVAAWSSAIHEFLEDASRRVKKAVLEVLLAIAHLPCLREHLPKERWSLIEDFPFIMFGNPPLQRCLEDTSIFEFLKNITDSRAPFIWLGMLWITYDGLSPEVKEQLKSGTRWVAGKFSDDLQSYVSLFDSYVKNLENQIAALDPLSQTASSRRARREQMLQSKAQLVATIREIRGIRY